MKKIIFAVLFLCMTMVSFSQKTVKSDTHKTGPLFGFTFSVQSDWVGVVSPGCFTVNIRVYMHSENQITLIANQNVNVGDCGTNKSVNSSTGCESSLFKDDLILASKDSYQYCLKDLLEDEIVYIVYKQVRDQVIELNK